MIIVQRNPVPVEVTDLTVPDADGDDQTVLATQAGQLTTYDKTLESTMGNLLKELQKITLHLSVLTDEDITNEDVE